MSSVGVWCYPHRTIERLSAGAAQELIHALAALVHEPVDVAGECAEHGGPADSDEVFTWCPTQALAAYQDPEMFGDHLRQMLADKESFVQATTGHNGPARGVRRGC